MRYLNLAINERSGEVTVYAPCTLSKAWDNGRIVNASITETPATAAGRSLLHHNEAATCRKCSLRRVQLNDFFILRSGSGEACRFALWIDVEGAMSTPAQGAEAVAHAVSLSLLSSKVTPSGESKGLLNAPSSKRWSAAGSMYASRSATRSVKRSVHTIGPARFSPTLTLAYSLSGTFPVLIPMLPIDLSLKKALIEQLRGVGLPKHHHNG